ncbi:hypothetical protein OG455_17245 [Kitasatospora sp. NBC_01287]|uniref:hypothetical protein n=1 Tax=Kitasatospora sp. NBC_01287 TaxID=2903573 RepID=UPI00225751FB|nr:hypothetical protein [Kitasatospora sp. NBC_01287]MCX4747245.1 hypothetical protein [Kitasatospora sp. NBC_01287]
MNFAAHNQAVAALDRLTDSLDAAGVDLGELSSGWRITPAGTVLVQLRPLHPTEVLQLAHAIRPPGPAGPAGTPGPPGPAT